MKMINIAHAIVNKLVLRVPYDSITHSLQIFLLKTRNKYFRIISFESKICVKIQYECTVSFEINVLLPRRYGHEYDGEAKTEIW